MTIIYQTISYGVIVFTFIKLYYYLKNENEKKKLLRQYTMIEAPKTLVPV